jgi:hypothetical protein
MNLTQRNRIRALQINSAYSSTGYHQGETRVEITHSIVFGVIGIENGHPVR